MMTLQRIRNQAKNQSGVGCADDRRRIGREGDAPNDALRASAHPCMIKFTESIQEKQSKL